MSSATEKQQDVVIEETVDETHVEYEQDALPLQDHNGSGFCWNKTCSDKEDDNAINALSQAWEDGKITWGDALRIYQGRTV